MPKITYVIFIIIYFSPSFSQNEDTIYSNDPCLLLHQACYDNDLAKVKILFKQYQLDANCVLDALSPIFPIHYAVTNGNNAMILWLLNHDAYIDAQDKDGYTPLHLAILLQKDTIFDLLLANGANVNLQDKWGRTPLLLAIEKDRQDLVEKLLQFRPNVSINDFLHLSVYEYCTLFSDTNMANVLYHHHVPCPFTHTQLNAFHISKLTSNFLMQRWLLNTCQINDTTFPLSICLEFYNIACYFNQSQWKKNILYFMKTHYSSDSLLMFRKNLILKKDLKITHDLNKLKMPRGYFFVFHPFISFGFLSNGRFFFARTGIIFSDYNHLLDMSVHLSLTCWPSWNKINMEPLVYYQIKEKRYMVSAIFQKGIFFHEIFRHTAHLSPGIEIGYTWGFYPSLEKEAFNSFYVYPLVKYNYNLRWLTLMSSIHYINFHQNSTKWFISLSSAIRLP
ncbi:MAG: ankyrin repeat domain-containing protein [Bacteroidales bacterium]|nr:ankyrin repeat domain-containing protein [Bacteroidales bacterium]